MHLTHFQHKQRTQCSQLLTVRDQQPCIYRSQLLGPIGIQTAGNCTHFSINFQHFLAGWYRRIPTAGREWICTFPIHVTCKVASQLRHLAKCLGKDAHHNAPKHTISYDKYITLLIPNSWHPQLCKGGRALRWTAGRPNSAKRMEQLPRCYRQAYSQ